MTTSISVIGTIATDPKLFTPTSGTPLCSFRLASDERRYDREKQSWVDGNTNWFGVVAFRSLATHSHESFKKGDRVIVSGRLRMRNWEKDDKRGTAVEIEAEALGHDVRWGVSRFDKRTSAQQGNEAEKTTSPDAQEFPSEGTAAPSGVGEGSAFGGTVADTLPTQEEWPSAA